MFLRLILDLTYSQAFSLDPYIMIKGGFTAPLNVLIKTLTMKNLPILFALLTYFFF